MTRADVIATGAYPARWSVNVSAIWDWIVAGLPGGVLGTVGGVVGTIINHKLERWSDSSAAAKERHAEFDRIRQMCPEFFDVLRRDLSKSPLARVLILHISPVTGLENHREGQHHLSYGVARYPDAPAVMGILVESGLVRRTPEHDYRLSEDFVRLVQSNGRGRSARV